MWLSLEVGSARSLGRRARVHVDVPLEGAPPGSRRRALVVEAAHTYFPEAAVESLPEVARSEVSAGLRGRLRSTIAETDVDDPDLPLLRDLLVARLGGTADVSGALCVIDRVYAGRLLRRQVPPIISASCLVWYGHWRTQNAGPSLAVAETLRRLTETWVRDPDQRSECDAQIIAGARQLVGTDASAIEDAAA